MSSVIVAQILVHFLELLFVPVIANETIYAIAASHIEDVDTLQFRAAFSHSFDSLVRAGYEEREAEIAALNSTFRSLDPYSEVIIPSEFSTLIGQGDNMPGGVSVAMGSNLYIIHAALFFASIRS